jgi:hypothetical protein
MQSHFCRGSPSGDSRPMDHAGVCWFAGAPVWWCSNFPVARPNTTLQTIDRLFPKRTRQKERCSPVCSTWDQRYPSDERGCRTAGAREAECQCRLPRHSRRQRIVLLIQWGRCQELASSSMRVQQRGCAWERATALQSSFSQLKFSENRRKHFFISNEEACCMQRRHQRFPTVRTVS